MKQQHRVISTQRAFLQAEDSHRVLSEKLGASPFFISHRCCPTSADIVAYAYLSYEASHLPRHPHIKESLEKYSNLTAFLARMKRVLSSQQEQSVDLEFYVLPPSPEVEHLRVPVEVSFPEELSRFRYRSPREKKYELCFEESSHSRRMYVTSAVGILFLFLLLKGPV